MRFYHITTNQKEIQKILIPHIPDNTLWEEDITTKRISVCPKIKGCIAGISQNEYMKASGKIIIYEIELDEKSEDIYPWEKLYKEYNVYDAPLTHEYWINHCIEPTHVYERIVSNIITDSYLLASPSKKKDIIYGLKEQGLYHENMNNLNVFEISNYCGKEVREAVKKILTVKQEDGNSEIYRKIFGEDMPPKYDYLFIESTYITNFKLSIPKCS